MNIGELSRGIRPQVLPPMLQTRQTEIIDFEIRCRTLCSRLLRLFALGLEVGIKS